MQELPVLEDRPPIENLSDIDESVSNETQEEDQSMQMSDDEYLTFQLPGNYCRAPNGSRNCLFYGCQNTTRCRIPKSVKLQLLLHSNYYVPPHARVCQEHLVENSWDLLVTAPNRCFEFSPQNVFEMLEWLKAPRSHIIDFENLNENHDAELYYWTGRTRDEFERIFSESPSLVNSCRNSRTALGILLSKLRTGESNARLSTFFGMSRQNLERLMKIARECLDSEFVPRHIGFDQITREQIIEKNLEVPTALFANSGEAILICDGTYMFTQKSSNFSFQKETYSLQKHRNLIKPFLLVACDGTIIDICGPYHANKSDSVILNSMLGPGGILNWMLEPGDIFILDRGFRDSIPVLEENGFVGIMPESRAHGASQLSTILANKSRMCTICRWPVEVVNGRLKRDFKLFRHEYCNLALPHFFSDLRIAAALTNAFHVLLLDSPLARDFIQAARNRLNTPNHLADFIDENRLNRNRAAFEFISADDNDLQAFPILTHEELVLFAVGTYQVKLAPSYYSEHVRNTGTFLFQKYMGDVNVLSSFNMPHGNVLLLRARIKSRHISAKVYHCYILIDADNSNSGINSICHYYCTCFTGRRTIGCCAHVMCLVWFLGLARHQNATRRPALFLDSVII